MKRIMRFWTLLALLAMTACEHKELCYEHPHVGFVRVLFDWSQLPGANPECIASSGSVTIRTVSIS